MVVANDFFPISQQGKFNDHYRLGRLPTGINAILRKHKYYGKLPQNPERVYRELDSSIEALEGFCQEAETAAKNKKFLVTSFCVGLIYGLGKRYGAILIEDLNPSEIRDFRDGDKISVGGLDRIVKLDLSDAFDAYDSESEERLKAFGMPSIRFFSPDAVIDISKP
ncbi:hypothetical protein J4212_04485 [Candidatus Woesearchaeota archaeon]|nr:hypothetical protein [Candidatus Woesearchaeota archaeon]